MSIFSRDKEPTPPPQPASPVRPAPRPAHPAPEVSRHDSTHIASGSKVLGEISGTAELVIDGHVEGQIDLDSRVVVGEKGRVEGEIQARAVQVSGQVVGNVRGHERVEVMTSGRLEGDVISPRVVIAEGAFFKGKVEMTEKASPEKKVAPPPAAKEAAPGTGPVGDRGAAPKDAGERPEGGAPK